MQNNTTMSNRTQPYINCNLDAETIRAVSLYAHIATSICSFVGNLLVIIIVYRNKNLRTSTNYFIVSLSVSDILFPFFRLLDLMFYGGILSPQSNLVRNLLCKLLSFIALVSYGVSILTLVVLAIYRLFAVMSPLRARVQNKRKLFLVLLFTWLIPIVVDCPILFYIKFGKDSYCNMNKKQYRMWLIPNLLLFQIFPLLIMLVLYPLIIINLKQHRVPGNLNNIQAVIRRRRRNCRLTIMFLVLTVPFLLCWGPHLIMTMLYVTENTNDCTFFYVWEAILILSVFFHAINPVIYFTFLSSFRQGFKNIFHFSRRNNRIEPLAPGVNFELNIPQGFHN